MADGTPPEHPRGFEPAETVDPDDFFDTLFLYKELHVEGESHPSEVGPYKILQLLEEGGMGAVYLAERTDPMTMKVALKLMKKGMTSLEEVSRFEVERQALALMNHPNIASVKDAGATKDGKPFFAMEYVEGGVPLTNYCDQKSLGIQERLLLFVNVCDALQHAHQRAIIHRDLKPQNVLVADHDGRAIPKVIDFGIAKIEDGRSFPKPLAPGKGRVMGTPEYMAPEQTRGDEADTRTDTYALGVILYELLVGVLPVESETLLSGRVEDILTRIREGERPLPSRRLSDLDPTHRERILEHRSLAHDKLRTTLNLDLDWVVQKAVHLDPEERYQSAADLKADIRNHLDGFPVGARPATFGYRARKFLGRNRRAVGVAAGVALLLLSLLIVFQVAALLDSSRLLESGKGMWDRFARTNKEKSRTLANWNKTRDQNLTWLRPWEREEELRAWGEFTAKESEVENLFSGAVRAFRQAHENAPFYSGMHDEARRALERAYYVRHQEALEEGNISVPSRFFADMVRSVGLGTYETELSGVQQVRVATEPTDARIYCFRYEKLSEYLRPLPFSIEDGIVGRPFLRIWKVAAGHQPFRPGDRFVEVIVNRDGRAEPHAVGTRGNLAKVLSSVGEEEEVTVKILRPAGDSRAETTARWVPYPSGANAEFANLKPGTMREPWKQFGFLFEGYPLEFAPASKIRKTSTSPHVTFSLPPGSYLLVMRREGYVDARLPISIPTHLEREFQIRLLKPDEIPEGYVRVPGGSFSYGGDVDAYESLDRGTIHVDDFFIRHLEVTWEEYLEFLNAPETLKRLNEDRKHWKEGPSELGWVGALAEWESVLEKHLVPNVRRANLLPSLSFVEPIMADEGDRLVAVKLRTEWYGHDWPALAVSLYGILEYAHWLSTKNPRWVYRLPTDFEWEKAARGRDRRRFVWGDYLFWSFANTTFGDATREDQIGPIGTHPMDESVYGILDMTGSASEPVLTLADRERIPKMHLSMFTFRGANWDATDHRDLHLASRGRGVWKNRIRYVGFRLVAKRK